MLLLEIACLRNVEEPLELLYAPTADRPNFQPIVLEPKLQCIAGLDTETLAYLLRYRNLSLRCDPGCRHGQAIPYSRTGLTQRLDRIVAGKLEPSNASAYATMFRIEARTHSRDS